MRGLKRGALVLTVALVLVAAVTACQQSGSSSSNNKSSSSSSQEATIDIGAVTASWARSAHSQAVTFAAEEAFCAGCHNGAAFATGTADPKKTGYDFIVATDCRACHTGRGAALIKSGQATITTDPTNTINASTGAVCLGCHRELAPPSIDNTAHQGPHPSSQGGVWHATGGIKQGLTLAVTKPHAGMKKACVTCHMTGTSGGPNHQLRPVDYAKACGQSGCHGSNISGAPNLPARGDYDGNGQKEGIQTEVGNLQAMLESATLEAAKATTMTEEEGRIIIMNGSNPVKIDNDVYMAAYNLLLTRVDGSQGVHNPAYVVSLLQQSYKQLTGREVTGAVAPK